MEITYKPSDTISFDTVSPYMGNDWAGFFWEFVTSTEIQKIFDRVQFRKTVEEVYPTYNNCFNAFKLCPMEKLKVVILGQDPYHTPGIADGLAFSSNKEGFCPPSLRNILKEVRDDIYEGRENEYKPSFKLDHWAEQGVLLLNTALTVAKGQPESHLEIWKPFTEYVIQEISRCLNGTIFVLWGKKAQAYKHLIAENNHYIIESPHPSPFSASRGFFGSKPFSRINEILEKQNGPEYKIQW